MTRDPSPTGKRPAFRHPLARAMLMAGLTAFLGGCLHHDPDMTSSVSGDYRKRHPIVVKERDQTTELFVGNSRGSLIPSQRAEAMAFARHWRQEATGGIVVEVPRGSSNQYAAADSVREITAIFTAAGVPANAVSVRSYRVDNPTRLATVRLSYPRMVAEAGPCGYWPSDMGPNGEAYRQNKPYWNFGCASQRNLAAMVANPADLVQPRGEAPVYRERRTVVLEHYRKGEQTSSTAPNNDSAKISDVGK